MDDGILYNLKNEEKSKYDLLVAYSGGKDSTYVLYQLIKKYKLNVLSVTFDNHFISEMAMKNVDSVVKALELDHITIKYDFNLTRSIFNQSIQLAKNHKLQDMFRTFGILCWPCFMLITMATFNIATAYNIKYIAGGWSFGQLANLNRFSENHQNGFLSGRMVADLFVMPLYEQLTLKQRHPQIEIFKECRLKDELSIIPYFLFEQYDERNIFKTIQKELGWLRPEDTDGCSTNCLLNSYGNHLFEEVYHYNRYAEQLSRQIRIGQITREEALRAIENIGRQEIINDIKKCLERLN